MLLTHCGPWSHMANRANTCSGNGLVSSDTKPLPEQMLIIIKCVLLHLTAVLQKVLMNVTCDMCWDGEWTCNLKFICFHTMNNPPFGWCKGYGCAIWRRYVVCYRLEFSNGGISFLLKGHRELKNLKYLVSPPDDEWERMPSRWPSEIYVCTLLGRFSPGHIFN